MSRFRLPFLAAALVIFVLLFTCRPVFAIGFNELAALILLILLLLGPALFKLAQSWKEYQESQKNKRDR